MLKNIVSYLQFGNNYCGLEHTSTEHGEVIYGTVLRKKKNELLLEKTFETESLKEAVPLLSKDQHAFLIVNTDQVLTKQIDTPQNDNQKTIYKAFPNINLTDFYFEITNQKTFCLISICRKAYIDKLIEDYKKGHIHVINFSLGNHAISNILEYVSTPKISTSNNTFTLERGDIRSVEQTTSEIKQTYDINGLKVSDKKLLSLSGALQTVLSNTNPQTNFQTVTNDFKTQFFQQRFFTVFLKSGLVFILGLLLVNFLFFNHYFDKVKELQRVSQINQESKSDMVTLNEVVGKKQKMVADLLKSNASKSSMYIDVIVQSLPKSILLSDINYQPLLKRIKEGKPVLVDENIITVSGSSNNSDNYSFWISELESVDWIENVSIINYGSASSNTSDFSIKIHLIHD